MIDLKNELTTADYKRWLEETFWFSVPALIAFFSALAGGLDFKVAMGFAFGAIATALQNLYGKYKSGIDPIDVQALKAGVAVLPELEEEEVPPKKGL